MRILKQLTLAFFLPAFIASADTKPTMLTQLAEFYLKSFHDEEKQKKPNKQDNDNQATVANVTELHLSPREERVVVFHEVFAKSKIYQDRHQHMGQVLNQYAWNDLHLFRGTTTTPEYHFLSRINKTITTLGEGALASLISAPIADLHALTQRQQIVRCLYKENQLRNDFQDELQNYKQAEKGMLSFWTETNPLYNKEYDKYLTELFYTGNPLTDTSARSLQIRKLLLRDTWHIYSNYIWYPLLGVAVGELLTVSVNEFTHRMYYSNLYPMFWPIYSLVHIRDMSINGKKIESEAKTSLYSLSGYMTLHSFWQYYKGYRNYKEYSGVLKHLALRMADIQTFLNTAKQLDALVQHHPQLEALYGQQLSATRALLAYSKETSQVGNLLSYLEELPLRSWSYLSDNAGKLLASYRLFVAHKAIFHDAMYELGQLDAFVSIAALMQETDAIGAPHTYAFTTFLSPKAPIKPCLTLTEMWNPMLEPMAAIGNDVAMGAATHVQNIILTGPNAGGKSTFLTGVVQAILLSQTFGVAPAKSCEMTPFSKINTYIDVTDDIAAGKSLFLAEACRFQEHLSLLRALKEDEWGFSIFDEPFSGTNPTEGAAAEYSVLNFIAKYNNSLSIVATHYPTVMLLEQNEPAKGFRNYKVFINHKGKDHKIEYTYKVIPGESNQTIAIDILAEQGYPTEMLEQARDIIDNPEKYRKSFTAKSQKGKNGKIILK
ncbi:MutS-related protein [Cardinium endosymbiont of Tipula unca]|uniref:MutS-related protein n=1 Tax=Cardinium endosymbiont of Tipula unca TaxID=3066216 RepID=UPI0030CABC79